MFHRAVIKLTAWYVIALLAVVVVLSIPIFGITSSRLDRVANREGQLVRELSNGAGRNRLPPEFSLKRQQNIQQERDQLLMQIILIDVIIVCLGAVASYYFAKYTLEPIEESHRAQSRFTADASHQLRTPLSIMQTEIDLALRKKDKKSMEQTLISNLDEINRLKTLSDQLLTLTKADNEILVKKKFNLSESMQELINKTSKNQTSNIKTKIDKNVTYIGDERLILEAVGILLNNAIKYSNTKEEIIVSLNKTKQQIKIVIQDNGIGIKSEELSRIFERFYRGSNLKSQTAGYGLGLPLANEIVQQSGGYIKVNSQLGSGSTFSIILPCKD